MFRLDAVLIWATFIDIMPTKQPLIILVITCFLYIFMLLMLYFLVFKAVLMGWAKFGIYIHFGYCICNFYVIYQIIIYVF